MPDRPFGEWGSPRHRCAVCREHISVELQMVNPERTPIGSGCNGGGSHLAPVRDRLHARLVSTIACRRRSLPLNGLQISSQVLQMPLTLLSGVFAVRKAASCAFQTRTRVTTLRDQSGPATQRRAASLICPGCPHAPDKSRLGV